MPVQTVDATPSDIKLLSKVVFMKPGKRFGLSAEQKIDVWRRWKAGQTLHEIGRAFGKEHSSIRCLVARYGGIVPAHLASSRIDEPEASPREISSRSRSVSARSARRRTYRASQADGEAWHS